MTRGGARALLGALTLSAAAASGVGAQQQAQRPTAIQNPDGSTAKTIDTRRGFNLFGSGDIAVTGMKQVGQQGWAITNYGPGAADGYTYTGDFGHVNAGGVWRSKYFEMALVFGAPRHEFRKIRNVYPNIGAVALGGGYTFQWNRPLLGQRGEIAPSDNSLGTAFSGVQSTADGSCKDIRSAINGYVGAGATLLPMSDCPETWGPIGFLGPREINGDAYLALRDQLGNDFNWQYWSAGPELQGSLLGNFSTFGYMTDYTNEILQSYGATTPLSTRAPVLDGYPLGLDFKFDAFSFALPSLANAVIYQLTVVNNSANVYGTGIDYDSLYGGLELGFYDPVQVANTYWEPGRNAVMSANRGVHPNCNGTRFVDGTPTCPSAQGFNRGAVGVVVLKSPIGDMRNKLFTTASSPFYDPTSPAADDTITMNHGHKCGYGSCYLNNLSVNARRQFGLMSSNGEHVLDGRAPGDLQPSEYYYTFRNHDFPQRTGKFNSFVPGNWDYNNDGVQDTIFFDTCDETVNNTNNTARGRTAKCVSTWSDSMPGGFVNSYGNVFGMATVGPFALRAGDTTSFVFAFTGGADSASIEAITDNVISNYLQFWAGPKPPPPPTIISASVGETTAGDPRVELIFGNEPEVWVDTFLVNYANALESSTAPDQVILRTLNPNLPDQIRARAAAGMNFNALYVYRSCNGGASWDANGDCVGDPSINLQGQTIGNGWRPYHIIRADANGQIPNVFLDNDVTAGRTYLYSLVTQSRGFRTTVLDSIDGELVSRELVVVDSLLSPVPTSGRNVRSVYVPISFAAGTTPASFTVDVGTSPATVPVNVRLGANAQEGTYIATYGDRFILTETIDLETGARQTVVDVQRFFANAVDAAGNPITGGAFKSIATYSGPGPIGLAGFTLSPDTVSTTATTVVTTDTLTGLAFVLSRNGQPLFISTNATAAETTPTSFLGSPLFPGFQITIDPTRIGAYQSASEITVKPVNDTLPQGIVNNFGVAWQESQSTRRNGATGTYEFTFGSDAYGPAAPFVLNLTNGAVTEQEVQQSLAARPDETIGDTTAATLAAVRAATGNNAITLVPGRFPFSVENVTFGRPVTLAMISRASLGLSNTLLLGPSGPDTLRIAIDSLEWVPGDQFAMLETVMQDSTVGGAVVIDPATGLPFQVQRTIVTFAPAVLACGSPRASCNPVRLNTPGSTGYLTYTPGTTHSITYDAGFRAGDQFTVNVTGRQISSTFGSTERRMIRVVPNPYVAQSEYDQITGRTGTSRVYFSHVPADGVLRIYSVSGQLLQQLRWTQADLNGTGDLPYDLRTREGTDLASGLYIWTIQATSATNGDKKLARGKFVVIR